MVRVRTANSPTVTELAMTLSKPGLIVHVRMLFSRHSERGRDVTPRNLWLTLPLGFMFVGCATVRPMCVEEPTTCPKTLDEPASDEVPRGGDPPTPNAFAPLAGNRFTWKHWHAGPRMYCPLSSDPPTPNAFAPLVESRFNSWTFSRIWVNTTNPMLSDEMKAPRLIWERIDQPVAAAFYSFSGCNVAPSLPPSVLRVIRDFSLTGGGPMTGITIQPLATSLREADFAP